MIASLAGLPRRARLAGKALKLTPTKLRIPWHRVTTSNGRLAFTAGSAAYREQCRLLAREGIVVVKQRVDMLKHAWPPRTINLDELLWRD